MQQVYIKDLGEVNFITAWKEQEKLFTELVNRKLENKKHSAVRQHTLKHYFLFCEHTPVYTIGKSGKETNLLLGHQQLQKKGIDFHKINRGGDITFHGPGQIVGYPILDLDAFFNDIHKYMRSLEEIIILLLQDYGIKAGRIKNATGVWLDQGDPKKARKICAMGVRCSRWVTMHGFALNVNTNLEYFTHIIPCGILDKEVTSMEKELGRPLNLNEIKKKILHYFAKMFDVQLKTSEHVTI